MEPQPVDPRRLGGILAERRISHTAFARQCGLSRAYTSLWLCESVEVGELAQIKLARGIQRLGLDREARHAS